MSRGGGDAGRAWRSRVGATAVVLAAGGCAGPCARAADTNARGSASASASAAAVATPLVVVRPTLASVTPFEPVRAHPFIALPAYCTARAPMLRARAGSRLRLAVDAHSPGAVAFAEVDGEPARVVRAAGLVPDANDAAIPSTFPWFAASTPAVARSASGSWVVAASLPSATAAARIALVRGLETTLLGEGDGFEAIDLGCSPVQRSSEAGAAGKRCALLTTRLANVAAPGAELWIGDDAPPAAWRRVTLGAATDRGEAHPVALARPPDAEGRGAVAVLQTGDELAFWEVADGTSRVIGTLPAPFGLLDAIAAPTPLAMTYGARHDEAGCADDGGRLRFERAGRPPVELRTPTPPVWGALRALGRGLLATWVAPLACGAPRKVAFAVVLDAEGAPVSTPMAVSDASEVAVSTSGSDVDLWIAHEETLSWVRASCSAP